MPKKPQSEFPVGSGKKLPRTFQEPNHAILEYWSFKHIDAEGPYGWRQCVEPVLWLLESMKARQGTSWNDLTQGGSHNIDIDDLSKEAQKRLMHLKLDDNDELFSMRVTGKLRIFGIRDRNVFHVLWWDSKHEVCPSKKKHT